MTGPDTRGPSSLGVPGAGIGPLVLACLRVTDRRPSVDPLDGRITRDRWGIGLSPADGAALEHALRIAAAWDGRVVAVCRGPESVGPVLAEVAALGVEVVRIPGGDEHDTVGYVAELADDERGLAGALLAGVEHLGRPDLVLCGDRSDDRGTGALPAFIAHRLRAAQALGLVALEPEQDGTLLAERRLEAGWRERIRVPLPAVCSVEAAGVRLRRASLAGALAAGREPLGGPPPATPVADDGGAAGVLRFGPSRAYRPPTRVLPAPEADDPRLRLLALTGALVAHDPPTVVQPADAAEAADVLLDFLARHGYLPDSSAAIGEPAP